jgi:hypothetical protein
MYPAFVAADSAGNLFIHDRRSVRRVTSSGNITTILATATPYGMAIDVAGNVFTTQLGTIIKINSVGTQSLVAGSGARGSGGDNGPATAAQLDFIVNRGGGSALTVDKRGNTYFAENTRRIRKITSEGVISTVGQIP